MEEFENLRVAQLFYRASLRHASRNNNVYLSTLTGAFLMLQKEYFYCRLFGIAGEKEQDKRTGLNRVKNDLKKGNYNEER